MEKFFLEKNGKNGNIYVIYMIYMTFVAKFCLCVATLESGMLMTQQIDTYIS